MQSLKNKIIIYVALIFLAAIPTLLPLVREGFFVTDDGDWMIIRFTAFYEAFRDGQFPVRWLGRLNHTFGYPLPNFVYPLYMYVGVPIHAAGIGYINTIKIIFAASYILSGVFVLFYLRRFFSDFASYIGSLIYLYLPYHIFDMYTRGSIGEVLALALFPFLLWQIERKSILWTALGFAALLLSHNTLALFFSILIGVYILIKSKDIFHIKQYIPLILGGGISAFFTIPAILELQYTIFTNVEISEYQNYFASIAHAGYTCIAAIGVGVYLLKQTKKKKIYGYFFGSLVASIFLSLPVSEFIWKYLPSGLIQFPFRTLSFSLLPTAFLIAAGIEKWKSPEKYILAGVAIGVTLFNAYPYLTSVQHIQREDADFSTNQATTTVKNEYMPKWVDEIPQQMPEETIEADGIVENVSKKSNEISFQISADKEQTVVINQVYFPGWTAYQDGQEIELEYPRGIMQFSIPKGEHDIRMRFENTFVRTGSNILSCVSLLVLLGVSFGPIRKKIYNT